MDAIVWFVAIGLLLVLMALAGSVLRRLPLSASLLYLAAGFGLGHLGLGRLSPVEDAVLLERLTEICVLVSLFSAGLKLRARLGSRSWRPGVRLASISLVATVAMLAGVGVWALGLSVAAAILLAAIVAPTDPVLASDVQVEEPG